jgi:prepilin-type N-terminal cleavage/methylation domain-containing protein
MSQNIFKKTNLRLPSINAGACSRLTLSGAFTNRPNGRSLAPPNGSKGVTFIELLIALVISAILVAGIYRTFIHQQKTYATQEQVADMQQNVRVAINRMMKEIRMAGFGNIQGVLPVTFPGVGRTYPNVVNPDLPSAGEFTIVSAIGGNAALSAQPGDLVGGVPLLLNQIQVSALAEFNMNDKRYISVGGLESHFITAIDGPNRVLTLNTDVGNFYRIGGMNPTLVYAIRAISYQIDRSDPNRPILRRDENIGGGFQPVADNIEAIEFRNPDGSTPLNPNSMSLQVAVTARTERVDPELQKVGDGYRRRQFTSFILQRNRGL